MTHLARPKTFSDYTSRREAQAWTWASSSILFGTQFGGAFWVQAWADTSPWWVRLGAIAVGICAGFAVAMGVLVPAVCVRKRWLQRRMGERP